jgi:hypothetical protein
MVARAEAGERGSLVARSSLFQACWQAELAVLRPYRCRDPPHAVEFGSTTAR